MSNANDDNDVNINNGIINKCWTVQTESIIKEWCDIGKCYTWMHYHSYCYYHFINLCFQIPITILSTIIGSISFLSNVHRVNIITGSINISIGAMSAVYGFLRISQLTEQHRTSSLHWDKFQRNLNLSNEIVFFKNQ